MPQSPDVAARWAAYRSERGLDGGKAARGPDTFEIAGGGRGAQEELARARPVGEVTFVADHSRIIEEGRAREREAASAFERRVDLMTKLSIARYELEIAEWTGGPRATLNVIRAAETFRQARDALAAPDAPAAESNAAASTKLHERLTVARERLERLATNIRERARLVDPPDSCGLVAQQRAAEDEVRELEAELAQQLGTQCGADCECASCSAIDDEDEREACYVRCAASVARCKIGMNVLPRPNELVALGIARAMGWSS
jgi:hypothetical protein